MTVCNIFCESAGSTIVKDCLVFLTFVGADRKLLSPEVKSYARGLIDIFTITPENSREPIGLFSLSISRRNVMHQRAREDNLTICYSKKHIGVSFPRV